ncbi:major facilitator superfamily domain-containing protein [Aspergillus pseudoustus]|uniref:Major facilitator superfamily domain-containing protein n=1 Tax=Aspergillus pseudoustus TaxID=1810923 RepID=A0ABR4JH96_9EURO
MKSEAPSPPSDVKPPSEYTPRAWGVIAGASCSLFCSVGFINSFGVFQEYYLQHELKGESSSTVAWLGGVSTFFIFMGSVVSGSLMDLFGPTVIISVGSVGTVFSVMMTSLCHEFWQFILAQGILMGICMSLLVVPMVALIGQYIKVKRAAAMGIVISGSSLGGVVWPIVINELLKKKSLGFGWTMRIVGFIMIPLLTVTCILCRPAPAAQPVTAPSDGEAGTQETKVPQQRRPDFSILKKPAVRLSCFAFFIVYFGMFCPFFFTTSYAVSKGFSADLAFYTVSIVNGASMFGRIIPGIVADRYGRFNLCILSAFLSGIIALCWTKATSVGGLVVWCMAYGFTSGAILSLQQVCAVQIATPQTAGLSAGAIMASASFSAMASVPISGELAGKYGYLPLSIYSGVSLLVGSCLLVLARLAQEKRLLAAV